jgi:nucleoside-diphosphate-sugar epimerase
MKAAVVLGAGGFIGSHLVKRLKSEGYWVRGVDLKHPEYGMTEADDFVIADLRDPLLMSSVVDQRYDEVYQLAADMGGAGYINTGENDAEVLVNSALINLNLIKRIQEVEVGTVFYSSSACVYPEGAQMESEVVPLVESLAYPAEPDSEYGWEKLFSERAYLTQAKNLGTRIRIARFHNIYGPEGTFTGGKEKAPAALCRKVAEATTEIEIWGDGEQTRSFLYIDECIEGIRRLMASDYDQPINLGSDLLISINDLARQIMAIADVDLRMDHIKGPQGVRGRCSDNTLIKEVLGWTPSSDLKSGLEITYQWIAKQVAAL